MKKPSQRKQILPTPIMLLLSEIAFSFNRGIKRARFKHFPGASSKDLLHYTDLTLEEQNFEAAIIHTGVNYILYDSSSPQINLLL